MHLVRKLIYLNSHRLQSGAQQVSHFVLRNSFSRWWRHKGSALGLIKITFPLNTPCLHYYIEPSMSPLKMHYMAYSYILNSSLLLVAVLVVPKWCHQPIERYSNLFFVLTVYFLTRFGLFGCLPPWSAVCLKSSPLHIWLHTGLTLLLCVFLFN